MGSGPSKPNNSVQSRNVPITAPMNTSVNVAKVNITASNNVVKTNAPTNANKNAPAVGGRRKKTRRNSNRKNNSRNNRK